MFNKDMTEIPEEYQGEHLHNVVWFLIKEMEVLKGQMVALNASIPK